ncbi:hypothetical protein [Methanobrevibacter sp.]|uniref:hypothetical protein n=1 Tax=Methanobrevibacter sp. TaxID=66852 RepID=UPI0026E0083D|nr:hypothetical protein [Methanobrevibacter sp.]MDO5823370.1 hypothetical protein [Methanobrevibacter sp.]
MNKSDLKKAICAQWTACGMGHDCGADKQFTFNMGYGADNLFKKLNSFEMFLDAKNRGETDCAEISEFSLVIWKLKVKDVNMEGIVDDIFRYSCIDCSLYLCCSHFCSG